jgi:CBS domain-containing protein
VDFQLNLSSETSARAHPEAPLVVSPSLSVGEVLQLMQANKRGSVMVCAADHRLLGIFTERDVVKHLAGHGQGTKNGLDVAIEQVMVCDPVTVRGSDTVAQAIAVVAEGGYRRLPVVDASGQPTGVLDVSRVLEYLVEHVPKVAYTLPPQLHQTSPQREGA